MLIVIVIIGILIAALLPRMSAAQGRARDVSRKTALSQLQSAIVSYQGDKWAWPQLSWAKEWMGIDPSTSGGTIWYDLLSAWMSSIPTDPLSSSEFSWLNSKTIEWGQYGYMVVTKNGAADAWFVLMARAEMEWWANWVVCNATDGMFTWGTDISKISTCSKVTKGSMCDKSKCEYLNDDELRYVVFF